MQNRRQNNWDQTRSLDQLENQMAKIHSGKIIRKHSNTLTQDKTTIKTQIRLRLQKLAIIVESVQTNGETKIASRNYYYTVIEIVAVVEIAVVMLKFCQDSVTRDDAVYSNTTAESVVKVLPSPVIKANTYGYRYTRRGRYRRRG